MIFMKTKLSFFAALCLIGMAVRDSLADGSIGISIKLITKSN